MLHAIYTIHKFDIVCLYETFLNSYIQDDDDDLVLNGYKLVRADNPSDFKRDGVCIYFKESLPVKVLNITNLHEGLVCELLKLVKVSINHPANLVTNTIILLKRLNNS